MSVTEPARLLTTAEGIEGDSRWQLAQRIARSPSLSRAAQLRAILLYVVRHTILHPGESIHEFDIAHGALERRKDFNPLDDSIVRVQIAHLRKRLDRYFSTEGIHEETVITIALGSYEPIFSPRPQPVQPAPEQKEAIDDKPEASVHEAAPGPEVATVPEQPRGWNIGRVWLAAGWAITIIAAAWVGIHWNQARGHSVRQNDISNPILHLLFAPDADLNVVIADKTLESLQNMIHSDISIADYLDPRYPSNILAGTSDPALHSALETLMQSRHTGLTDTDVVGQCYALGQSLGTKVTVRYARHLHVRDFEHGNFIIVGNRRGNPWVSLFEPSLNFYFEQDPATHISHFRNRHPRPGEEQIYNPDPQQGGGTVDYVDIALLPNLTGTGTVLMLNGFSMATNEAAANLAFGKKLPLPLDRIFRLYPNSKVEILLRVLNLDKSSLRWEVVSTRVGNS